MRSFLVVASLVCCAPDTLFGSPIFRAGWVTPPDDGFFDQTAKFVGGIGDVDWTEDWTSFLVETDIKL